MNALEGAGFVHLYGLSSVLNALHADRRDLTTVQERTIEDENRVAEIPLPQAQFRPYLFVQERKSSTRRGQKATDAERVLALAEERNVPIAEVDKGILNTLSGNRPHQVCIFGLSIGTSVTKMCLITYSLVLLQHNTTQQNAGVCTTMWKTLF